MLRYSIYLVKSFSVEKAISKPGSLPLQRTVTRRQGVCNLDRVVARQVANRIGAPNWKGHMAIFQARLRGVPDQRRSADIEYPLHQPRIRGSPIVG